MITCVCVSHTESVPITSPPRLLCQRVVSACAQRKSGWLRAEMWWVLFVGGVSILSLHCDRSRAYHSERCEHVIFQDLYLFVLIFKRDVDFTSGFCPCRFSLVQRRAAWPVQPNVACWTRTINAQQVVSTQLEGLFGVLGGTWSTYGSTLHLKLGSSRP